MPVDAKDYVIRIDSDHRVLDSVEWNRLLAAQASPTPFMRHEYLAAMDQSASATPNTGWTPFFFGLHDDSGLAAASVLYVKDHSYGEYVFDWAWANAYQQHGLSYYPKAVVAPPFTPVPGSRLLARDEGSRRQLLQAMLNWCKDRGLSSLHLLFADDLDLAACESLGLMQRHTIQFHWHNSESGFKSFEEFLLSLSQEKRKKIRQERRKVDAAGVRFRWVQGIDIGSDDWDFFYACYERTYLEHGNSPYLTREFFGEMARKIPEHWLMFIGEKTLGGRAIPIAASLIALSGFDSPDAGRDPLQSSPRLAYGRYWGALERVDCLHFEACYYQPLAWCIEHGYQRFEGGAQGEHKMARAMMPVRTSSAHWIAHPAFSDAVERFLEREGKGVDAYVEHLGSRSPFRQTTKP